MSRLSILALEPYYGGSHRGVLDGLVERIDAEWTLLTLPARKWKWRMRGAAITMAEQAASLSARRRAGWDLIFASTFLNLAEFRGMAGASIAAVPAVVYFHENQLVYPNRHTAEWDFQFPLTNITTALSAELLLFNTRWNLDGFLGEVGPFLAQFPDFQPTGVAEKIAAKSRVVPPPIDPRVLDAYPPERGQRCRIIWPHRWEHDKNPEEFLAVAKTLAAEGLDFEVVIAGQQFRDVPGAILDAEEALGSRLVHLGEPGSREQYAALLASADVAVSTADNEFFGIAMMEAAYAGCFPLVPDRLAYPELYPAEMRYRTREELVARLGSLIAARPAPGSARSIAEAYTFDALLGEYRRAFQEVARGSR